ncbi:MAG: TGS domain-containing protein [Armatimonadota bacterium]|nr:TGS domain-containing protein [Armatimonadota bacterium]MDR7484934.1 TGS domain-containing protein [Armatimonadota bacterium]MDR7534620.1 TGS domain-containing protein [Armatimonadota bacterium]MDR7535448.1 TGS domain-containing protein [Armatimonadota bacterium]
MPANLTPEYLAADRKFKAATTPQAKLAALEEMLAVIPKHKGTEKMQADLKRRIARLRQETQRRRGAARARPFYHVDREGAGQIALVGGPNAGKSSLLAALTNASPEIADYPFTTRVPLAGMAAFEDVPIQLVDLPPVSPEVAEGWLYALIRGADGALVVVDLADPDLLSSTEQVLALLAAGGVEIIPPEASRGPRQTPGLFVAAKLDAPGARDALEIFKEFYGGRLPVLPVSAEQDVNLSELRREMFRLLGKIRVYSKKPGGKPDLDVPFILPAGTTVQDAAAAVHKDFAEHLRYARLWRQGEYDGQMVGRDHVLRDRDVLELHA